MSISSQTVIATAMPGTMLTKNSHCQEKASVKNPPTVGPKVEDRVKISEIITIRLASCGPRNFAYTTGKTVGVMAPPLNPCNERYTIICGRLVAVAHNALAAVKPSVAVTNNTRVDNSRERVPENGTITTSAIRYAVWTQLISS